MKRFAIIGGMVAALAPVAALGEPSPSVTKLMNTPVSLFSNGITRLREEVQAQFGFASKGLALEAPIQGRQKYGTSVGYDWDANRVSIHIFRTDASPDVEEECRQVFAKLRSLAWVRSDGTVPQMLTESLFAKLFLPDGYSSSEINPLGAEIDKIIELIFFVEHPTFV